VESEDARNVAAVAALYDEWAQGRPGRYALIAEGGVMATIDGATAARDAVLALPGAVASALVVALWPQEGWRHPRLVIDAYRRTDTPIATSPAVSDVPPLLSDPLLQSFLLAQLLHGEALAARETGVGSDPQAFPYLLIKDGVVLTRYKRVTQARQAVAAAMPPLAPVIFTSLRLGSLGPFSLMVQQALLAWIIHEGNVLGAPASSRQSAGAARSPRAGARQATGAGWKPALPGGPSLPPRPS